MIPTIYFALLTLSALSTFPTILPSLIVISTVMTNGNTNHTKYVGISAIFCAGVIVHCASGLPGLSVSMAGVGAVGVERMVVRQGMTVVVTAEAYKRSRGYILGESMKQLSNHKTFAELNASLTSNQPPRTNNIHHQLQHLKPQKRFEPSPQPFVAVVPLHGCNERVADHAEGEVWDGAYWEGEEGEEGPLGDLEVAEEGYGDMDLLGDGPLVAWLDKE